MQLSSGLQKVSSCWKAAPHRSGPRPRATPGGPRGAATPPGPPLRTAPRRGERGPPSARARGHLVPGRRARPQSARRPPRHGGGSAGATQRPCRPARRGGTRCWCRGRRTRQNPSGCCQLDTSMPLIAQRRTGRRPRQNSSTENIANGNNNRSTKDGEKTPSKRQAPTSALESPQAAQRRTGRRPRQNDLHGCVLRPLRNAQRRTGRRPRQNQADFNLQHGPSANRSTKDGEKTPSKPQISASISGPDYTAQRRTGRRPRQNTRAASSIADSASCAQRRTGRRPRQNHSNTSACLVSEARSTKDGEKTPSKQHVGERVGSNGNARSTKDGEKTPSKRLPGCPRPMRSQVAQRRTGRRPRQNGSSAPRHRVSPATLNEGRGEDPVKT